MKTRLLIFIALLFITTPEICSQQVQVWAKWEFLIGEWKGEGSGQPGTGGGVFSFQTDLDKNILVRKSHSEYPGQDGKTVIHDDLMIVYPDNNGTFRAIYFDNEKHVINYAVTFSDGSVILTSEKTASAPVFRLTYTQLENSIVNTKFEMSQDGVKFMTYIEGKSKKVK